MAFIKRDFSNRISIEKQVEPKRFIVIACEDENVQPAYFNAIKDKLNIPTITEIEVLPCIDHKSAVEHICSNLKEYIVTQNEKYEFEDNDEFWIIIDRESPTNVCHKILLDKLSDCEDIGSSFNVGVTNPLFELWLLLHVDELSNYDQNDLLKNERTGISPKSKRFIDKKLSELLCGYNKNKKKIFKTMEKIVTIENIQRAIAQEKLIKNDFNQIISNNKLGSNIGTLVESIIK